MHIGVFSKFFNFSNVFMSRDKLTFGKLSEERAVSSCVFFAKIFFHKTVVERKQLLKIELKRVGFRSKIKYYALLWIWCFIMIYAYNPHFSIFSNRIPSFCIYTYIYTFQSNLNIIEIHSYQDLFLKGDTRNLHIVQKNKKGRKATQMRPQIEHKIEKPVDGLTKFLSSSSSHEFK